MLLAKISLGVGIWTLYRKAKANQISATEFEQKSFTQRFLYGGAKMLVELSVIFCCLFVGQSIYMAMPWSTHLNNEIISFALKTHAHVGLLFDQLNLQFKQIWDGVRQS